MIAFNGYAGVHTNGAESINNRITQNSISRNSRLGIYNKAGGNAEFPPPTITGATAFQVAGTAVPDAAIEIYSDPGDQGQIL